MSQLFDLDPSTLPYYNKEKKGSLLLRSNFMKYGRATLDRKWHADREAEPKDYDVTKCSTKDRNLLKATYHRIGNMTDGSLKDAQTTQHESMREVGKLQEDYKVRDDHKPMLVYDNFCSVSLERDTGKPDRGYGSVLPRHSLEHGMRHLNTNYMISYQYPFEWTPKSNTEENEPEVRFHRSLSEFADTDGHKRFGNNTFQDCYGSVTD